MRQGTAEPIVVSEFGEIIEGYPNREGGTDATDETKLGTVVHARCAVVGVAQSSWADTRVVSPTHNAIVCRGCYRSWLFPNTIKTFGDLRLYFMKFNLKYSGGPSDVETEPNYFG